jgi:hypothetical protein
MQRGNARQRLPVSAIQAPFRFKWASPKPSALRPGPNSTQRNGHNRCAFFYRFASFYSEVPCILAPTPAGLFNGSTVSKSDRWPALPDEYIPGIFLLLPRFSKAASSAQHCGVG